MSDIVERLRRGEGCVEGDGQTCIDMSAAGGCICAIAAAEIERLRAALVRISVMNTDTFEAMGPLLSCIEIARAALKETSDDR